MSCGQELKRISVGKKTVAFPRSQLHGNYCPIVGRLSNYDGYNNENGKKAIGLVWQNNNFARASHLFVHFFAFTPQTTT